MDRAKTPSRKGKPEQAILCALASLREIGFPWLLNDLDGTQITEADLLRFDYDQVVVSANWIAQRRQDAKENQNRLFFAPSRLCAISDFLGR